MVSDAIVNMPQQRVSFEHLQNTVGQSPEGQSWLLGLPTLIDQLTQQWGLVVSEVITVDATASWVAHCLDSRDRPVVLKIGFPHTEARDEIPGLLVWQDCGAVPIIDTAMDANALLMEPCTPGTTLRRQPEPRQDEVIARMLKGLWTAEPGPGHPFRPLSEMVDHWISEQTTERQTDALTQEGTETYQRLLATTTKQVLMPTDLHAGNILAHGESWILIDPKPYVGDPAYDITQHLLNCTERLRKDPIGFIARMAGFTDQDPGRIQSWLFARVACASSRTEEDVALAKTLRPMTL